MPSLAEQIVPCGPTFDVTTAHHIIDSLRETARRDGWLEVLEGAWPAMEPVFGASPYLRQLARDRPSGLRESLETDPESRLASLIKKANQLSWRTDTVRLASTLRLLKKDAHLFLALTELGRVWSVTQTMHALSALADAILSTIFDHACRVAGGVPAKPGDFEGAELPCHLFVIAMGKLGANELNFSSDVDLSIFYEANPAAATTDLRVARFVNHVSELFSRIVNSRTDGGYVFRLDHRLRPDPSSSPLALPVDQALAYYEARGQAWERAAYIKARPLAGDLLAGQRFLREMRPFVWRRNLDHSAIWEIQSIRRQILHQSIGNNERAGGVDLKLGPGGIREIEFFAQTQQLIFGGRDPALRQSGTVDALAALAGKGYLAPTVARRLIQQYFHLRSWEHRTQMIADEQTHRLPADHSARRRIACLAGFSNLQRFDNQVDRTSKCVQRYCANLFRSATTLESGDKLIFTGLDDDPATLAALAEMGFTNGREVSRILRAWARGSLRGAATPSSRLLLSQLTPRLLQSAQRTGAPEAAFAGFVRFFAGLPIGAQAPSILLANQQLLDTLLEVMAWAPRLSRVFARQPAALEALIGPPSSVQEEASAESGRDGAVPRLEQAMDGARRHFREAATRISMNVVKGNLLGLQAGSAFTDLADEILVTMSDAVWAEVSGTITGHVGDVAVILLGKAGSREMTATSDLDIISVYSSDPRASVRDGGLGADVPFRRFTQRLITALSAPTNEGELYRVDMRLRPTGTAGPVSVSLSSFGDYYEHEAEIWELLALTRARVAWASSKQHKRVVESLVDQLLRAQRSSAQIVSETKNMKELLARERPPSKQLWEFKYACGGILDIELTAQLTQLVSGPQGKPIPGNTFRALNTYAELSPSLRGRLARLARAWRLQQNLMQFLKVTLDPDDDPELQPAGFLKLLARRGGATSIEGLRQKLTSVRTTARRDCEAVLAADWERLW